MPVTQLAHSGVLHVVTIRPADLDLPVSHPIDISHLVVETTYPGTG